MPCRGDFELKNQNKIREQFKRNISSFHECREAAIKTMSVITNFAKVFVYGTLKNGQPNHYWLTEKKHGAAHFIETGTTQTKFPLIVASQYNVPFLLSAPGTGHYIKGEIYSVDEEMMKHLDELEDYPQLYDRTKINISDKKG